MIPKTVNELLEKHITLSLEGIDRIYLNGYVPLLQTPGGISYYFKGQGKPVASVTLMSQMTDNFVRSIRQFVKKNDISVEAFKSGDRKDKITKKYLKKFPEKTGILYLGVAQEKYYTFRNKNERDKNTGKMRTSLYRSSVMCNQFYFYIVDEDFGPMFIKMGSYFPYTMRICLNGHEYLKWQLKKEGIAFEELDNGISTCKNPRRAQAILNELNEIKIERVIRKWLEKLPCPFSEKDREAGINYQLSILQAEFALTQVFDKPIHGRQFFEEVIKEHIDLGRPENVSLIFERCVTKRTPTKCRTRIITENVIPSLHVSYKHSKIKQYFKEGRALRTETVINNPYDFGIQKKLRNLPALREYGFATNRRLLDVQKLSQDCLSGANTFEEIVNPLEVGNQHAAALRFGDDRAMALFHALSVFSLDVTGFNNKMLRQEMCSLLCKSEAELRPGQMTYDLRRLRLHGLIERQPNTNFYHVTKLGITICFFFSKLYQRIVKLGISQMCQKTATCKDIVVSTAENYLDKFVGCLIEQAKLQTI